jgi:dihydrofolate synthase/folylpolyglutamate synthase
MSLKDTYNRCLKTMYGLRRFGIILGLETIKGILNTLGNPQNNFVSIHVAGTNGKGSVASALSSILHESGYKVGLYTSPHLVRFNERICINNRQISDADVVKSYHAVQQVHHGNRSPTFFEFATAMALYEFGRQRVDWAVIETGMGGRFDATNVIQPAISIITNVSMEHREYLGNTLAQITREKAGIIKQGAPVVTAIKQKQANKTKTGPSRCSSYCREKIGTAIHPGEKF